jgi:protocatechuate 4,5-dioxygenase alpha chain
MDGDIPGTTVFTGERSRQGYKLNQMANSLSDPANRERFRADEGAYMAGFGISPAEQEAIRMRDWGGMIAQGGNIYLLLKLAATVGQNIGDMQKQMRGETAAQGGH